MFTVTNISRILYSIGMFCLKVNIVVQMITTSCNKGLSYLLVFGKTNVAVGFIANLRKNYLSYLPFLSSTPIAINDSIASKKQKSKYRKANTRLMLTGVRLSSSVINQQWKSKLRNFLPNNNIQMQQTNAIFNFFS